MAVFNRLDGLNVDQGSPVATPVRGYNVVELFGEDYHVGVLDRLVGRCGLFLVLCFYFVYHVFVNVPAVFLFELGLDPDGVYTGLLE